MIGGAFGGTLASARTGDEEAFARIFRDVQPALLRYLRVITTDSEDVAAETWVHVVAGLRRFRGGEQDFRAWLFTILRNTFYSGRRKTRREVSDTDGIHAARQATRPEHDGRLALNDFRAAFEKLPDEQREALILVGASGFSYEEAAGMTGVAVGTVKSRANRGRRRLAELPQLEEGEELEMTDRATLAVMAQNSPIMR